MRVCIQVRKDGGIISEYFASWREVANCSLEEVCSTWAVPDEEDMDITNQVNGGVCLTVNIHEVYTGRIIYDEGVEEFGAGPYWKMEQAYVLPGIRMECLLFIDGSFGTLFIDDGDYVTDSHKIEQIVYDVEKDLLR